MNDLFTQIANDHFGIQTLEERHTDSLDFHDVAVWNVKAALEAAFNAGLEHAKAQQENNHV